MVKKLFFLFVSCIAATCFAQTETKPFEGEIKYETYENCSDYLKRMGNSIYFDGVHKCRMIIKGDKVHVIDETTQCHIIADASILEPFLKGDVKMNRGTKVQKAYIHFCDLTKTGLDLSKFGPVQATLAPMDLPYPDGTKATLQSNTFAATETTKSILGKECVEWKGQVNHKMGGMDQVYDIKAYVSDIPAPAGFRWGFYYLDVPKLPLKWIMKYDGGHISMMNVGELSFYIEADVTEIIPREVSDDEFQVPANYKIATNATNVFAMMKYYKGVKTQLEKAGIKGADNTTKTTGVHYKTNDEWDF